MGPAGSATSCCSNARKKTSARTGLESESPLKATGEHTSVQGTRIKSLPERAST
jgi:hypothetical protein